LKGLSRIVLATVALVCALFASSACGEKVGSMGDALTIKYSNGGKLSVQPTAVEARNDYMHNEPVNAYLVITVALENPDPTPDSHDVTYSVYTDATLVDDDGSVYHVSPLMESKLDEPAEVTLGPGEGLSGPLLLFDRPPGLDNGDPMLDLVWTDDEGDSIRWDLSDTTISGWVEQGPGGDLP
jgi:hypothetical protein